MSERIAEMNTLSNAELKTETNVGLNAETNTKNQDEKRNELMKSQWSNYLLYLKQWARDHYDSRFYGMTPACFDEWLDNEWCDNELYDDKKPSDQIFSKFGFKQRSHPPCKDADDCTVKADKFYKSGKSSKVSRFDNYTKRSSPTHSGIQHFNYEMSNDEAMEYVLNSTKKWRYKRKLRKVINTYIKLSRASNWDDAQIVEFLIETFEKEWLVWLGYRKLINSTQISNQNNIRRK